MNNRKKRQMKKAKQLVGKQMSAYKQMIEVGIGVIQRWASVADIAEPHVSVMQVLAAFVDASYNSKKPAGSKTLAAALAIRAAYLYGLHDGRYPKTATPQEE